MYATIRYISINKTICIACDLKIRKQKKYTNRSSGEVETATMTFYDRHTAAERNAEVSRTFASDVLQQLLRFMPKPLKNKLKTSRLR